MYRYEIEQDEEHLRLTRPIDAGRLLVGCLLGLGASLCLAGIGLLGLINEMASPTPRVDADASRFLDPTFNHFGFLWLIGALAAGGLVPLYAARVYRAATAYGFSRATGLFTKNGRRLAALSRIEYVQVRPLLDTDDRASYRLSILYGDGNEEFIDESYDEREIRWLAREIAGFVGVDVVERGRVRAS